MFGSRVKFIGLVPRGSELLHDVGLLNGRPPPGHLRELSVVEVLQRRRVDGHTRVGGHSHVIHPQARRVQGVDFGEGRLLRRPIKNKQCLRKARPCKVLCTLPHFLGTDEAHSDLP